MRAQLFSKTPLLKHQFKRTKGPRVLLKYEFLQPSGSFKSRGIGHLISTKVEEIKKSSPEKIGHVFASSGGNAGLAAAVASLELNVPCTVVVSNATRPRIIEKIRSYGADVVVHGNHWKEADSFMKGHLMKKLDSFKYVPIYSHPFDDPLIWEGHSFMVDEIMDTLASSKIPITKIKGIVCSFGGGGLYNGLILGLKRYNLADKIPIVCVETKGTDVLSASLRVGAPVEFERISSCATSLGTATISTTAYQNVKRHGSKSAVISDAEVISTCLQFSNDTNIVAEPGCGATLYFGYNIGKLQNILGSDIKDDDYVILIGCGGSSTSLEDLKELSSFTNCEFELPSTGVSRLNSHTIHTLQ
ncbi:Cha1 [Kluyveromyces lactis]|nr:Cha1 [Kluyveromyces lactis]